MPTHHIKVSGKVQGVFYRATAKKIAVSLGLLGWVKNMPNNDVEILATGPIDKLETFESWCRSGPTDAEVEDVSITFVPEIPFEGFQILR